MADSPTVDNGDLSDFDVLTDDCGGKHAQVFKLAYAADGIATLVPADSNGLRVDLSTNNDVVVSSGAVNATLQAGTAEIGKLAAGSALIGSVGVTSIPQLPTGANLIGKIELNDGSTDASIIDSGGTYDPLAVGVLDGSGDQLELSPPIAASATPSIDASIYDTTSNPQNLDGNMISFANAVGSTGGVAHIIDVKVQDKGDSGPDLSIFFLRASITPEVQNAAFTMTDADAEKIVAVVHTADGTWEDYVAGQICCITPAPPKPIYCDATTLYAVVRVNASYTPGSTSDLIITVTFLR